VKQSGDNSNAKLALDIPGGSAVLVGILGLAALVYAGTLRFPFVYDDNGQIVQNALVQAWRFVPQYFRGQVWQYLFPNAPANYYRPLNMLWFRLNDALFGLHPAGWHAATVLLHLVAICLVYLLARRLTGRPAVAGLTAIFFAIHPMRHEVVAWVSGSTESLWSVFFLCSFLAYLESREQNRAAWMAASCALYLAALLSKETSIVLPGVVFAHAWLYHHDPAADAQPPARGAAKDALQNAAIYAPVACIYLAVRIHALHGFSHSQTRLSPATFLLTLPSVIIFYVSQWLLPLRTSEFYDTPLIPRGCAWIPAAPVGNIVNRRAAMEVPAIARFPRSGFRFGLDGSAPAPGS
jgi:hypothetical protein